MVCTCPFLNILAAVSLSKISVVPNKQLEEEISEKYIKGFCLLEMIAPKKHRRGGKTWKLEKKYIYKRLKAV